MCPSRFAFQRPQGLGVVAQRSRQQFERNIRLGLAGLQSAAVHRPPDLAHAALAEQPVEHEAILQNLARAAGLNCAWGEAAGLGGGAWCLAGTSPVAQATPIGECGVQRAIALGLPGLPAGLDGAEAVDQSAEVGGIRNYGCVARRGRGMGRSQDRWGGQGQGEAARGRGHRGRDGGSAVIGLRCLVQDMGHGRRRRR